MMNTHSAIASSLSWSTDASLIIEARFVVGGVCRGIDFSAAQAASNVVEAKGLPDQDVVERRRTFYDPIRTMRITTHLWHRAYGTRTHSASQRAINAARCVSASHKF